MLKALGKGANGGNIRLTNGWSVRSGDYTAVLFVAAKMPAGEVVVFAVNGDPSDPGDALLRGWSSASRRSPRQLRVSLRP